MGSGKWEVGSGKLEAEILHLNLKQMKFTIQEERPIQSYSDLQKIKQELIHKSERQSERIKFRLDKLKSTTDLNYVFDEILAKFDLQHSLMNMLPLIFKYRNLILNSKLAGKVKDTAKKPKFIFVGTLATALSSALYFKFRKKP